MNRHPSSLPTPPAVLVEALEPRIAPAGLLNESKFTSVVVGGTVLLDASGGANDFQGLSTGFGNNGSYLLYLTTGKAVIYTTDLNGDGKFEPGEITGISLGVDSQGRAPNLILFSDVHGDIATNLLPGHGVSALTDSDNKPTNGRDGEILLPTDIGGITLRTITAADLDTANNPTDTVQNRLGLTSFSIYGNIYCGGSFGGLTIDASGSIAEAAKFSGDTGTQLFLGATPQIGSIETGTAASGQTYHFTQNASNNVEGAFLPFVEPAGQHGGDISNIAAASTGTVFSVGALETGAGGAGARGGNISDVTLHGDTGSYAIIAGDGGAGSAGGQGGSIINFNDLGSDTGQVLVHTGAGGAGLLGAGGTGGTATFASPQIAAEVQLFLGAGGSGFGSGGVGAGLASGTFTAPLTIPFPTGGSFVGTWHAVGDVGDTHRNADGTYSPEVIDFDGDGHGDGVFTTKQPDQVVVVFGDGSGSIFDNGGTGGSETVVLRVPGVVDPVFTVGDFNGDGKPDIAVASGDPNNFSGIYVFLDQIGNATLDPISSHNFSHNPVGDHPFSEALQTAIPSLTDFFGVYTGAAPVFGLTTGDYNHDGVADIGLVEQLSNLVTKKPLEAVGVLFGDAKHPVVNGVTLTVPTGYFFANAAAPTAATTLQFVDVTTNTAPTSTGATIPVFRSSALISNTDVAAGASTSGDVMLYSVPGLGFLYELSVASDNTHLPFSAFLNKTSITLAGGTVRDAVFTDVDNNGFTDLAVLVEAGISQGLVIFQGNGGIGFPPGTAKTGVANISLAQGTMDLNGTLLAAIDSNQDGQFSEFALFQLPSAGGERVQEVSLSTPAVFATGAPPMAVFGNSYSTPVFTTTPAGAGFGAFYPVAETQDPHPFSEYGVLSLDTNTQDFVNTNLYILGEFGSHAVRHFTENGYFIFGGDGGASTTSTGGDGGVLGTASLTPGTGNTVTGAISITFPMSANYGGTAFLQGGNGADGFGGGGDGGSLEGLVVRYATGTTVLNSDAVLMAGFAGNGVAGNGGAGGSINHVSVDSGSAFTSGAGGNGVNGGAGGSIIGNGITFDTRNSDVSLTAGNGGQGNAVGGTGGSISGWGSVIIDVVGSIGGGLNYTSGTGGDAASGTGGQGGSITGSSPDANQDAIQAGLILHTGAGGSGLTGGDGGIITTFINQPTDQTAIPTVLSVVTGGGGIGVEGNGGVGGSITGFQSNATGLESSGGALVGVGKIIAGDGGASYGAAGGNGGVVSNVTSQTTSTPIVVAGGAGGDGLTVGGQGGSVLNSVINSAAQQIGKVLVVAGAGGDASSALPAEISLAGDGNTADAAHALLAFGGVSAHAGDGGDISKFTQPVSTQTAVDLIAGNGGSTLNAGTSLDTATGVGHGGSVVDVNLAGTVGAVSRNTTLGTTANPPIQAYAATTATYDDIGFLNTVSTGTLAISDIVRLLANPQSNVVALVDTVPTAAFFADPNAVQISFSGNVGIVAGAAGRVRNDQPARDGLNGSVQNITAESIMSIVAGSVSAVAPVNVLSGITITDPDGVLGVDRTPIPLPASSTAFSGPNGILDYYTPGSTPGLTPTVSNLQAGYSLVDADGALFAITIQQTSGTLLTGPRVFQVTNT